MLAQLIKCRVWTRGRRGIDLRMSIKPPTSPLMTIGAGWLPDDLKSALERIAEAERLAWMGDPSISTFGKAFADFTDDELRRLRPLHERSK